MPFQMAHLLAAAQLVGQHQLAAIITGTPGNQNIFLGKYLKIFHQPSAYDH